MNIRTMLTTDTLNLLTMKMKTCPRFAFVRFGDGEFKMMQGINKHNHRAHPMLQKELIEAFLINDPDYLKGLSGFYFPEPGMSAPDVFLRGPAWYSDMMPHYLPWQQYLEGYSFLNADVFGYTAAFKIDRFIEFMKLIERPFVISSHGKTLEKIFGVHPACQLSGKEDYFTIDRWYPYMLNEIATSGRKCVILAGGPGAKAVAKRLWYQYLPLQILDMGSVLDACLGIGSRGWIRAAGMKICQTVQGQLAAKQS